MILTKPKIGFVSLGCSKNRVDTEVMLARLIRAGYEVTAEDTEADVIIVNTCAFTEEAKRESIDAVLDLGWLKKHKNLKKILVAGCMAERYGDEIKKELPEVDGLVGVGGLNEIEKAIASLEEGGYPDIRPDKNLLVAGGDRVLTTPDFTAYLKIAEGCDNRCAFCAIPSIRGAFRSRTVGDIVSEAKDLESLGVRELTLIAQDTTRYGADLYGSFKTADLIRAVLKETSIPWIRTLYSYPDKITDDFLDVMATESRVLPYVDMPVQHISDKILRAMNRHGDAKTIRNAVARLRDALPGLTLRTTLMVGFPGETEADFDALLSFIKETRFDRLGVFAFSPEEGTPAFSMPGQIDEQTKQDRLDRAMALQMEISAEKNREKLGTSPLVLCEGFDAVSDAYYGRSAADAPEIDGKIFFTSPRRVSPGDFVKVRITETLDYDLVGEVD